MKKKIPVLPILAVVVAIIAAVAVTAMQPRHSKTDPPTPPPVSEFQHTVAAVGLIEPSSENIDVGSRLSGIVEEVLVHSGDEVTDGAPLFVLESRHLRASLRDAAAAVEVARSGAGVAEVSLRDAQDQLRLVQAVRDPRAVSEDDVQRRRFAVTAAQARLHQAQAAVRAAEAGRARIEVDIDRSTVRAPIAGTVLKVNVRAGEFASSGPLPQPLLVLGRVQPLYVRVDVDEQDAARIDAGATAIASLRGDASIRSPLRFVRIEPLVVPKRSLTGGSDERVDTRVLQVLYELERRDPRFLVGQQMDVFIKAGARS
jgi:RND family efflux transporter MFP subunit